MTEAGLIRLLRSLPGIEGIGDDCAVLPWTRSHDLLVTTDQFIENIHYRRETHRAADCGWKALARGLSDIAAMGGTPTYAFVSLAVPQWADQRWVAGFYRGLLQLARSHRVVIAGGDVSRAQTGYCDITVLGQVPHGAALRRSGARPGDIIYVTGMLGGGQLGLTAQRGPARRRHLRPEPRLAAGRALRHRASAAMDLSDGLSSDLGRLAAESRVAAHLSGILPLFPGASLDNALHGGDDYELLFTAPSSTRLPQQIAGLPVTPIGRIAPGTPGRVVFLGKPLQPLAWDSFRQT